MAVTTWLDASRTTTAFPAKDCNNKGTLKMADRAVYPSQVDQLPEDATHVVWFNR